MDGHLAIPSDPVDPVRNADLSARFPFRDRQPAAGEQSRPLLFPGSDLAPSSPSSREAGARARVASAANMAIGKGDGVEFNFEGADIPTVAKALLGDTLEMSFVVDPRVQGTVTLASAGPIPRQDVLPVLESVLRMSNAAMVREGSLIKIVPIPEASGTGSVSMGAGQAGYGVSVVPLRYTSAVTVAKMAESFLSRPGAIRADAARNLLLIQGTTLERQGALDVVASFDVEWLRNQSVGLYPLKSTSPETMIRELDRIFESGEGGQGQGVVQFQPVSRMNAVMVVTKNSKLLDRATQWIRRLDRSDTSGTTLRTYRLRYGNSQQVAKILNDIFVGRSGGAGDSPANQLAPATNAARSRLDSLGSGSFDRGTTNGGTTPSTGGDERGTSGRPGNPIAAAFEAFSDRKPANGESASSSVAAGEPPRGVFQNVRITADGANNSIVIYSNQEDYRVIERAVRDLDRPPLQVAIDATVAEVTLTDDLQYGVQFFLTSNDLKLGGDKGSVGLFPAVQSAAQTAFLERVLPGFNLLLGPEAQPRMILDALSSVTKVKVLSSPSLVVVDNQPALLEVGDEIPITTSSATILANPNTPVVNTIEMRNTGVILKVLPRVHANGTVQLEIEQEISNVVNQDQQTLTPTIAQRRIHSTVAVTSGQTVLLGGLISEREDGTKSGIPGLRQIRYLGDLFGNTSRNRQRSEIIVFIRPQLIRNSVDAQAVAEEFRERLQTMRSESTVVEGTAARPSRPVIIRKY